MVQPRARVIIDNDFSGDPDDLFQLAHHLLSPSVVVPFVIGSHLRPGDPFDSSTTQADNAAGIARDLVERLGSNVPVFAGSNVGMAAPDAPIDTPAARAIIAEALRDDTELPLYIALGAGLTELASALLLEPGIAGRLTAVWIGGSEHDGLAVPPAGADAVEYNLAIDVPSAQAVFNDTEVTIWQVPRDAYRQALVSHAELAARVWPLGAFGAYLEAAVMNVVDMAESHGFALRETYVLGDSPLVLITALQTAFQPDSASSFHVEVPTPTMTAGGRYEPNPSGRPMRVYTRIDNRLMFEDMYAKFARFAATQPS